jgi:chaperonin cofactor prefoldin
MANYLRTSTTKPTTANTNLRLADKVMIGADTDPSAALHVTGETVVTSNITAYYSSDISLKDNIRPIESAIFKVKQIRGVTFDWNEKSTELQQEKGHDVGLIAQEVEKVLPEVVQIREDGIMAIQYEKVVPLLVEAIKEQQVTIENLTKRIELLENGNSRRI